jgi:peptidoglycan L-alanyl-D-glutamate endopeptidase CwlK
MNSRHITGHAVDLAAWVGEIRWDMGLYYQIADAAIAVCKEHGHTIRWGGAWTRLDLTKQSASALVQQYATARQSQGRKAFIDAPHFELPATLYP